MKIEEIGEKIKHNEYEITFHAEKDAENITLPDLDAAISNGEILEEYPNDPRGLSCLILGYSQNQPIHIVCGYTSAGWIRVVTVYVPKLPKWINERVRVKGGEKGDHA